MRIIEKIKKTNLKAIIKGLTLLWFIVLIVFMTLTNIAWNKEFVFLDWIGNTLILFGIMVFGILMGESMGEDAQKNKVGGMFQNALARYDTLRKLIEPISIYFAQYYDWFIPQELESKKIEFLIANGVKSQNAENIVKYCTLADYQPLCEHPIKKEDGTIIRQLNENEKEPVLKVLNGEIKLEISGSAYYLTAFGKATTRKITEMGVQFDREIKFNKRWGRAIKITTSLAISLGMAMFTVSDFASSDNTVAFFNLLTRIATLFTSMLSGWLTSVVDVKIKAERLENKSDILTMFHYAIEKGAFKPQNEKELAEKEYEQYLKEQEEAKANIVEPALLIETKDNIG